MATYEHSSVYQLFNASKGGDLSTLERLLKDSPDDALQRVMQVDDQGRTALHYAKNKSVAHLLLGVVPPDKRKEYLRITSDPVQPWARQGPSWLLTARVKEPNEKVRSLSSTALDCAAVDDREDVVEYICSLIPAHELVINHSPLHLAASAEVAKLLVESVPPEQRTEFLLVKNEKGQTALHFAMKMEISDVIKYLCSFSIKDVVLSQDEDGNTALHLARNESDATSIVESFHDPIVLNVTNKRGETVLHTTTRDNQVEVVTYLCVVCPDNVFFCSDSSGGTALHLAKSEKLVEVLINSVPGSHMEDFIRRQDNKGMTALLRTVCWGAKCSVVKSLLKYSRSQNALLFVRDVEGRTVLHYVRSTELVELLLDAAEDEVGLSQVQDKDGNTALMFHVVRGLAEPMQYLLDHLQSEFDDQVFINLLLTANSKGQNVFHLATISPLANELMDILLEYAGCEELTVAMRPDIFGNTPLIYLAARFDTKTFASLLMMFPLWERKRLVKQRNVKGLNCEVVATSDFKVDTYMQDVLCVDENVSYREFFQPTLHSRHFPIDKLFHPEKFITRDPDLMRVLKYSLNEYKISDLPTFKDFRESVNDQPSSLVKSPDATAAHQKESSHAVLWFCFEMELLGMSEINKKLYEIDSAENHGLPKMVFIKVSTEKQVMFASPPGPDFIIITVASELTSEQLFKDMNRYGNVQQLVNHMRKVEGVKYININSTLAKHFPKSPDVEPEDAIVVPVAGSDKGRGLVISFTWGRDGFQFELETACHFFRQLGLEPAVLMDLDSNEMLAELATFAALDHGILTAVAILSHGDEQGNILASDPQVSVTVQQVIDSLCHHKIQTVVKLLFLSFSRGPLGRPRHNRVNSSWECTKLPSLAPFNMVRRGISLHDLELVRRSHPFPSIHPPENCYVLFSTLPDSSSFRKNSATGEWNRMFSDLSDYLTGIGKVQELIPKHAGSGAAATKDAGSAGAPVKISLTSYLTDVTALVRQTSSYTQHLNYCYSVTKDTKPAYLQVSPEHLSP